MFQYKRIAVGGTFDRLHSGHKAFLDKAFEMGEKVDINIASDGFNKNKFLSRTIQPYSVRKEEVEKYLDGKNIRSRANIFPLHNIYGTALTDRTTEAIIVTSENRANANKINTLRKKKGFRKLTLLNVSYRKSSDKRVISSSRIRLGEIMRDGEVLLSYIRKNRLHLPAKLRKDLRTPIGQIIPAGSTFSQTAGAVIKLIHRKKPPLVVTVGDIITSSLLEVGYRPSVSIIDLKSRRKKIFTKKNFGPVHQYLNQQGTISRRAVYVIHKALKKALYDKESQMIIIKGEEDLLVVAVMLLVPLGSLVIYGQHDVGVIIIEVDELQKKYAVGLIQEFL